MAHIDRIVKHNVIPVEDLKRYFECPVCLCVPRNPPIYQCDKVTPNILLSTLSLTLVPPPQGHMICSSCRPKVLTCPQCRGRLQPGARLYFAERLLEEVPVPCRFSEEGCQVELPRAKLGRHEGECEYREVGVDIINVGFLGLRISTFLYEPFGAILIT